MIGIARRSVLGRLHRNKSGVQEMGIADKAKHQGQNVTGKAKESVGRARGDQPLKNEGRRDQKKSKLKTAGDNIRAAFKR